MFKIEIMEFLNKQLGFIVMNEDQQKIVSMIKTWDSNTIKTAIMLDDSQGVGAQELYKEFLIKYDSPFDMFTHLSLTKELFFPVHYILLHSFTNKEQFVVPKWITKADDFYSFIYDHWRLIGIQDEANLEITFDHLGQLGLNTIDANKLEENTILLLNKLGCNDISINIEWLPF